MGYRLGIGEHITAGDLFKDSQMTTALLRINGDTIGVFLSEGTGKHAEDFVFRILRTYIEDPWAPVGQHFYCNRDEISKIDVFISRSPCETCGRNLIEFARYLEQRRDIGHIPAFQRLRFFCATIYKGNGPNSEGSRVLNAIQAERIHCLRIYQWEPETMPGDPSSESLAQVSDPLNAGTTDDVKAAYGTAIQAPKLLTRVQGIPPNILPRKARFGVHWGDWYNADVEAMDLDP